MVSSADVKANIKQETKKSSDCILKFFIASTLKTWNTV